MLINDALYGEFDIQEQVLIDVINSKTLQRLKKITPSGFYPAYYPQMSYKVCSRYKHSIGVFLLLRKYGAGLEEQIAGLIHDVSHTAFSHTVDYVAGSLENQKQQNKQDDSHEKFVKNSDIADILKKYNLDIDLILDDKNWSLKENNIPDICADRIDYSLRDGLITYNMITKQETDKILSSLTNYNGSFVFSDFETAKFFAEFFWKIDEQQYSGFKSAIMFSFSAKLFKLAITKDYIELNDFYNNDDQHIIDKINSIADKDNEVKMALNDLYLTVDNYKDDKNDYLEHTFCKVRRIDPYFLENGQLIRVSQRDENYKNKLSNISKYSEYFIGKK